MTRRDMLTTIQGLLIGIQGFNAIMGMMHGNLYITAGIVGIASAGQYIVHNMGLDTPTDAQSIQPVLNQPSQK